MEDVGDASVVGSAGGIESYTNVQNPNLTNIQRVMKLIGFTDYVERQLILGKRKDKV